MPVRTGDGTGLSPKGFSEIRKGDGTVLFSAGSDLITDGLVSRWTFEDGGDTTTAVDSQGGNDGTINGPTYTTNSQQGDHALSFDGMDDWVQVDDSADLSPTDAVSISAWVYATASKFQVVFDKGHDSYWLKVNDNEVSNAIFDATGTLHQLVSNDPVPTDSWHHLAASYDGATQRCYLDGSEIASQSLSVQIDDTTTQAAIGRHATNLNEYWGGHLDDVRVYDRGLSASEVQSIANQNG